MLKMKIFFYSLLSNPNFYNFTQHLLGASAFRKKFIENLFIKKNAKILDIGCGTSTVIKFLNEPEYYGYDISSKNINFCKKKFGNLGNFYNKVFTKDELIHLPKFDYIFLFGFIHHINDNDVISLFKILKLCLKPNGYICTIDGVLEKKQNSIARFLISRDRGQFVRTKESYIKLTKDIFFSLKTEIIHWKFFPYTYMTMIMK